MQFVGVCYLIHNSNPSKEHLADTHLYISDSLELGGSAGVAFPSMELKAMTPFDCCVDVMLSYRARTYNTLALTDRSLNQTPPHPSHLPQGRGG